MNIRAEIPQPSAYESPKADPIRLADATIRAVDQLGIATSEEIDKTAEEIVRGAAEIAEKLGKLRKLGVEYVLLNGGGLVGHTHDSLGRFAREVMPAFADDSRMRVVG